MHCIHCGEQVVESAKFCAACGTKVLLPEEKELRPEPPASVSSTPDAGWVPTTTLEHLWYWKPDSELEEALQNLARYTEESQQAIRAEAQRRLTQAKYEPPECEPGELVLEERPGVYLVMAFVVAGVSTMVGGWFIRYRSSKQLVFARLFFWATLVSIGFIWYGESLPRGQ